jgi:hypothetical protein
LRRIGSALLLALVTLFCVAPASAGSVPSKRASQKQAKNSQKVWKQYVKERNKTQGKPPKQHYPKIKSSRH